MHIPDGYLAPQTYLPAYAVAVPFWVAASAKVKRSLASSRVPFLALGAAFCFVVMMFNVPVPGGTTAHAVGSVLLAVLLGPWEAVLAVSLVLLVQALMFGDGGVTALGANCLSMAIVMPFTGWGIYRLISAGAGPSSPRHWIGAAIGGYVGL
ncbi:MAG TPA: energy-coupling factor ABC transporter permease, partial [Fimbriimonadaceae bacterium]|nr:energy-coupling factor ABC transporter permease [Fimbriimonadaceae bacterium]